MQKPDWLWPGGKQIAVVFNVAFEAWSDGKAPGISPMGNPLPNLPGIVDSMAISWAAYGAKRGIYRLLEGFARHRAKASVMTNAVLCERFPEAVKAAANAGHEILSHSWAMDVMPVMMSEADELKNLRRCTDLLEQTAGKKVVGWISPRGTPSLNTARLLAENGYRWYGDVFDEDLPVVQRFGDKRIAAIPLSMDVNDMRSMKYGEPPREMLATYEEIVGRVLARGEGPVIIDVTVHAHIHGHAHGAWYYERIVESAAANRDIWIATRGEIAELTLSRT